MPEGLKVPIDIPEGDHSGITKGIEHFKEFHRLMHKVTEISPGLGLALKAIWSPVGAAILAATWLLSKLVEKMDEAKKKSEEVGAAAAEGFGGMKDSIYKAGQEIEKNKRDFSDWARHVADKTNEASTKLEQFIAVLHQEADATREILEAEKSLALARLAERERRGQISGADAAVVRARIEGETAASTRGVGSLESGAAIAATVKALTETGVKYMAAQAVAEEASKGVDDMHRKTRLEQIPKDITAAEAAATKYADLFKKEAGPRFEEQEKLQNELARSGINYKEETQKKYPDIRALRLQDLDKEVEEAEKLRAISHQNTDTANKLRAEQLKLTEAQDKAAQSAAHMKTVVGELDAEMESLTRKWQTLEATAKVTNEKEAKTSKIEDKQRMMGLLKDINGTPLGSLADAGPIVEAGEIARKRLLYGQSHREKTELQDKAAVSLEDKLSPEVKKHIMELGKIIHGNITTLQAAGHVVGSMFDSMQTFQANMKAVVEHVKQLTKDQKDLGEQVMTLRTQGVF